jgi:predicted Zn-dependent protease
VLTVKKINYLLTVYGAVLIFLTNSCATNPVTGKSELHLVSEREEISIGQEYYPLLSQAEGGEYVADLSVEEYVIKIGKKLAAVSDRPGLPYEFRVLDNTIPNAWALPGGKISVNIGLLVYLENEAELAAVLAHEIVHSAARHTAQAIQRDLFIQSGLMGLSSATNGSGYQDTIMQGASIGAGLITTKYSRSAELEADKYGIKYMEKAGYDPSAAITLQEMFVKLDEERNTSWLDGLFATHPPSEERVVANRATANSYPQGGFLGEKEYKKVMSRLIKVWPAYEAHDRGYKLLARQDPSAALSQAEKAIEIEPREGHFYNLQGKALVVLGRYQEALRSFNTAIDRNDNYFDYYLQRGLLKKRLGKDGRTDLQKSFNLLPTQQAYDALGGQVYLRAR